MEIFTAFVGPIKPAGPEGDHRPERRRRVRTRVRWPVLLFRNQKPEAVESLTQDLSSGGFYCLSRTRFAPGEGLQCTLKVPTHDPTGREPDQTLECKIRVMRVDTAALEDFYGIACRIEDYRFAPAPPARMQ